MTPRKHQRKVNGHAGRLDRANGGGPSLAGVNGHGPASTERGGVPELRDRAASDDAGGGTVARDAGSMAAPGTVPQACAEVTPPHSGKKRGKKNKQDKNQDVRRKSLKDFLLAGPTDFAAMQDGAAYVNSVASRVDLVGASILLLGSTDEKIAKAELDRLRDMKFGKPGAAVIDESLRLDSSDWPRPLR